MKHTGSGRKRRTHLGRYRVTPGLDDGWDVVVEQGHSVRSTHCSDWHRVERICAGLDRQQRRSGERRPPQPS